MKSTILNFLWFTIVSSALAYVVLVIWGQIAFARASGANEPVVIRDELGPGSHHLFGMVTVPRTCDELHVEVQQVSASLYELAFSTWQEPSVTCDNEATPRVFNEALFAPAVGIDFIASEDGTPFPITVVPVIHH